MFAIYSMWIKCSVENVNYKDINIYSVIKQNLVYYSNIFKFVHDKRKKTLLELYIQEICNTL